jgi:hypothetical protein
MLSRSVAAFFFLLSTLALVGACNGQSEGDVCDPRNGNGDCRNGYACTPKTLGGDRCCPTDLALVTTAACGLNQGASTDASSAAPVDDASSTDGDASDGDASDADGDATTEGDAADGDAADGATADATVGDGATADGASSDAADGD